MLHSGGLVHESLILSRVVCVILVQLRSAPVTVRMYDNLFSDARPEDFSNAFPTSRCFSNASGEEAGDFLDALSGDSCKELTSSQLSFSLLRESLKKHSVEFTLRVVGHCLAAGARCEPSISAMWKKHQANVAIRLSFLKGRY